MNYAAGNTPGVIRSSYRGRKSAPVSQTISRPQAKGAEHNPWFWHPFNVSVRLGDESFRTRLHAISPDLEVTWNPMIERWQAWARAPRLRNGWRLLFIHWDQGHEYLPLDERLFARIAASDNEQGASEYLRRVLSEFERDQEKRREALRQDAIDRAMPYWEHSQIKNIGKGNKFSTYFA